MLQPVQKTWVKNITPRVIRTLYTAHVVIQLSSIVTDLISANVESVLFHRHTANVLIQSSSIEYPPTSNQTVQISIEYASPVTDLLLPTSLTSPLVTRNLYPATSLIFITNVKSELASPPVTRNLYPGTSLICIFD